jgi:alpha-tubulin suppressor-like RCC1 family protein
VTRVVAALAMALPCAIGCVSPKTAGSQCDVNSDCEAPLVCRLDRCRQACVRTRDCPPRLACALDAQGRGSCLLEEETRCVQGSDCAGGLVCRFGRCTNECEDDGDCVPPTRCFQDPETGAKGCFAGDVEPTACTRDGDCEGLQRCFDDGLCRPRCLADRDCGRGEVCRTEDGDLRNNRCVFVGVDAGPGMDAGPPDAGPPDAGPPDAGPPDAGPPDAGPPDAGPPDAGMILRPCSTPDDCAAPGAATDCSAEGYCVVVGCDAARGDCDADPATGCEASLFEVAHCGACDVTCGAGQRCDGLTCTTERVVEVASGQTHTCARTSSGEVVCWGGDGAGQLGDGTETPYDGPGAPPTTVGGVSGATSVCAGRAHTCAVHGGGAVSCWGDAERGQLGPAVAPAFGARSATPVAVSGITDAVEVVCGDAHTCVRLSDGTARCFGSNGQGRLGDGTETDRATPAPVVASAAAPSTPLSGIVDLAAGSAHTCAVLSSGEVRCWGRSDDGQLGDGTSPSFGLFGEPFPVPMLTITDAVEVAAGAGFTCVRTGAGGGALSCTGSAFEGQLGDGTTTDRGTVGPVSGITDAAGLTAGRFHACARLTDGSVRCWGNNDNGEIGDGSAVSSALTPTATSGPGDAADLSAGEMHTCAVRDAGGVVCWGGNPYGQLGARAGCCGYVEGTSCFDVCDTAPTPEGVPGL